MGQNSKIEWTDHTFNPWMGCTKVSPACQNCYAERDMDHRYGKVAWGPAGTRVLTSLDNWRKPYQWAKAARMAAEEAARYDDPPPSRPKVFCASLADIFEDWGGPIVDSKGRVICKGNRWEDRDTDNPISLDDVRAKLFQLIRETPDLDWLLLTKRPENVERMCIGATLPNALLGVSIENQEWANKRLPYLHAAKRKGIVSRTFVSAEPLVGPIILQGDHEGLVYNHLGTGGIDWVITGGESGPDARPCKPEWFRSLRDQCMAAGTAFHFKQWGEFDAAEIRVGKKSAGRSLDGREWSEFPSPSLHF